MTKKKDYFWNSFAGIISALEAVIMSMLTTRLGTLEEAGILTIAFAVGNLLMTLGKFGARNYHVTDVTNTFCYKLYIKQRAITITAMVVVLCVYLVVQSQFGSWNYDKIIVVIFITVIYMIEAFEDCVWGELQRNGYLYVGGRMFTARWLGIICTFAVVFFALGSFVGALLTALIVSLVIFIICLLIVRYNRYIARADNSNNRADNEAQLGKLFRQTLPLFIASFCVLFLNNLPKFVIDDVLTDIEQACYGFVAMPVFVIALVNQFIYQPYMVSLAEEWNSLNIDAFSRRVRKQLFIVLGISIACIVGAALIGVPVLSWLYNTDLIDYWNELVILQIAGFFLALSGYLTVILTTMRENRIILVGYLMTLVVSIPMMIFLTRLIGTLGSAIGYLLSMLLLTIIYAVMYKHTLRKELIRGKME